MQLQSFKLLTTLVAKYKIKYFFWCKRN